MRLGSSILVAVILALATTASARDWKGRARIEGRVTGESGAPLRGATVTVDRLSSERGPRLSSDGDGRWVVDGIASGSWMVVVEAPGYRTERIGVHLPGESSWLGPLEVTLKRPSAAPATQAQGGPTRPVKRAAEGTRSDVDAVRAALAAGRIDRARDLLSSLDTGGSDDADRFFEIGSAFLTAGATVEAAACFAQALALDPAHVNAHYHRALTLLALGRHDEAREDFEAVVDLEPEGALAAKAHEALGALGGGQAGE